MQRIETIIFDMDGVIIDSEPIHMRIEQELFQELNLSISMEEHKRYVGTSAREMWEEIVDKYKPEVPASEILKKKHNRYLDYLKNSKDIKPLEGSKELIIHLHDVGKQLVLASSSTMDEIQYVVDKFNIHSYFSFTISGAELARSKPDPEIFLKASSLSQTLPEQCCVIEDSQNGVRAAKAAGMKCIGFRNPNSGNQDLTDADIVIDDFKSINIDRILSNLSNSAPVT